MAICNFFTLPSVLRNPSSSSGHSNVNLNVPSSRLFPGAPVAVTISGADGGTPSTTGPGMIPPTDLTISREPLTALVLASM